MVFPVVGGTQATGDLITNSLRFNDNDTPSMTIASLGSSSSNAKKWTVSFWAKLSSGLAAHRCVFSAGEASGGEYVQINFSDEDRLQIYSSNQFGQADNTATVLRTNALYRDVSAWYHVVYAIDFTDGTEADRIKLYVNGSRVTSFAASNNIPAQNTDNDRMGANNIDHFIGKFVDSSSEYFDGYLAYFHFIDGDAKAASDFGETNDNGVWVPTLYTGSFGNNGFKLQFKGTGTSANASGMGADTSGNDNHFTPTNLAALDVTTDTPQNNFSTLNIVNKYASPLVAEGALEYDSNSSSGSSLVSTIAPSNGKWYVEVKALTSTIHIGVPEVGLEAFNVKGQGATRPNVNYQYGGGVEIDGSIIDNEATFTSNDIIGIALNLDDGEVIFYKNGTALNSGTAYNLHTNTTHGNTGFGVQTATGSGNTKASFNLGNPAFAISSGNSDANGYGNFEYAVPDGYYALCTKNLAEYG